MAKTYSVSIAKPRKKIKKRIWNRRKKSNRRKDSPKKRTRKQDKGMKKSKRFVIIGLAVIVLILGGLGFYGIRFLNSIGLEFNPLEDIPEAITPKLDQDNGITNILLVGIDTREDNPGLMNTDTIMVASIDHENKTIMLVSAPRDLYVKYPLPNGNTTRSKINSAYANGEWQKEGSGMETLQALMEEIIGEPIHYNAKVTLSGFIETIDAIGGIDIEVTEDYTDAYPKIELPQDYQENCNHWKDRGYCLFTFEEGTHHLDGQMALIYSRMRLLSPSGDFDRARRQQRVLDAAKNKILSTETLLDAKKLWELYTILEEHFETSGFSVNDIRAALVLKDEVNLDEIGHVVLDPYLGNVYGKYIYVGSREVYNLYHITIRDETYEDIQALIYSARKYPGIYNEATKISIHNATGNKVFEKDWIGELEADNPLFLVQQPNRIIPNPNGHYTEISIYKFTEEEKPASEEYLKEFFGVEEITIEFDDGTINYLGEDYVIVIGVPEEPVLETETPTE
jgi:LCP family protein required for cell wall assembly